MNKNDKMMLDWLVRLSMAEYKLDQNGYFYGIVAKSAKELEKNIKAYYAKNLNDLRNDYRSYQC
jgi:hypothetical protein